MTARDAIRLYWLPTLFAACWVLGLSGCGTGFGLGVGYMLWGWR